MNQSVKLALDFAPLAVFFVAYRTGGIFAATAAIIATTLISLTITYIWEKRVAMMPLISGVAITIFGGLTLWLNDELFVKMKPTLVNLLFAAILLGGLYFKKPMLKYLLAEAITLQEEGWRKLSRNWGLYFVFLAGLNEFIWRNFSTDFWVDFKVFGMFASTMIFTISQVPLMKKYWVEVEGNDEVTK